MGGVDGWVHGFWGVGRCFTYHRIGVMKVFLFCLCFLLFVFCFIFFILFLFFILFYFGRVYY